MFNIDEKTGNINVSKGDCFMFCLSVFPYTAEETDTFTFIIRDSNSSDGKLIFSKNFTGLTGTSPLLQFTTSEVQEVKEGSYYYEIYITSSDGNIFTRKSAKFIVGEVLH